MDIGNRDSFGEQSRQRWSCQPMANPKLDALATLAKEIVAQRGHISAQTMDKFLTAGYRKEQVLDVLIGVALKTISNYTHHISPVDIDTAFQPEA